MMTVNSKSCSKLFEKIWFQYLIVLFAAGFLYFITCAPTVLWQDSGLFIYRIWHNDIEGNLGIALSHPLYIMLGIPVKWIPVGEFAWRVNMISAIFGAVAVANLYLLLRLWLGKVWPAVIGAVSLAVSWTFWQNAVWAEAYTLYAAQLFTELLVLFQYIRTKRTGYLYWLGFLNGLSIANHLWGVFPLACYGLFLLVLIYQKQIKIKHAVLFSLLWILGCLPYLYLIVNGVIESGDFVGTMQSALFGSGWQSSVLNTSITVRLALENFMFVLLNFPTPNIILLFVGIAVLWEKTPSRGFANILFALLLMYFIFAFRYKVPDRHAFFLPFYCIAALMMGLGSDFVIQKFSGKKIIAILLIFSFLPIGSYFITPALARNYYPSLAERRQRPYRDEYDYWLQPWKNGYRGAERFAKEALESVEQNAMIYAYTTDVHTFLYIQEVCGKYPDMKVVSNHDCSIGQKPLDEETAAKYVSQSLLYTTSGEPSYYPDFLARYDFVSSGLLWKVVELNTEEELLNIKEDN